MRDRLRRLESGTGSPQNLRLSKLAFPIMVRPGTDDIPTILNNVIREEYAFGLPVDWQPNVMIDAGAFIGDTSAYFLSRYRHLNVIALEPECENIALARANLNPYGAQVTLQRAALAGRPGTVRFSGSSVAGSVQSNGNTAEPGYDVPAKSVEGIIDEHGIRRIDLLKMDIEGAELDVLRSEPGRWLPKVDMVIAELHGPAITAEVRDIMAAHGFKALAYRSLTFFRRPDGRRFG